MSRSLGLHALLALLMASTLLLPKREGVVSLDPPKVQWIENIVPKADERAQPIVETDAGKQVDKAVEDAKWGEKTQIVDRESVSSGQQKAINARRQASKSTEVITKPLEKFGINYNKLGPQAQARQDSEMGDAQFGQRAKEFVKGYKEGDRTLLNTKEFVFFGYFQRIREGLNRAWEPILKEKIEEIYHAGRQLASETEHLTRVYVVLDGVGGVVNVLILDDSGTQQLDEAAVQAFKKAGPFPNPPRGLLDPDGQVRVRWEFILRT